MVSHRFLFVWGSYPLVVWIIILLATSSMLAVHSYSSQKPPFLRKQDMVGIWKLALPRTPSSSPSSNTKSNNNIVAEGYNAESDDHKEIVLRLNDDGTFDPYGGTSRRSSLEPKLKATSTSNSASRNEMENILWQRLLATLGGTSGCWEYEDKTLTLAVDRPTTTTTTTALAGGSDSYDTVLQGSIQVQVSEQLDDNEAKIVDNNIDDHSPDRTGEENDNPAASPKNNIDVHLSIPNGRVSIGKYMYPKTHRAFFDEPMLHRQTPVGIFAMKQVLGNLNTRLSKEQDDKINGGASKSRKKYHKKDFYGRTFYLTAMPHKVNPSYAANDKHYDEDKAMHDVRVMPITFHSNNTFSAIGAEKILRGRYGIIAGSNADTISSSSGDEDSLGSEIAPDRLWFQVSLFGAGRSAPGSVFSEGRLLSHDDRRGYVGPILEYITEAPQLAELADMDPEAIRSGSGNQTLTSFFVEGEYFYGTDLKRAIKPNSMGTFSLQEIAHPSNETDMLEDVDDDDEEELNLEKKGDGVKGSDSSIDWNDAEDAFQ